jgi:hypothetical protein
MKRLIGLLALAAALAAVLVVPAATAKDKDYKGPACTNFIAGDPGYGYNETTTGGIVEVTMTLDAPACAGATYLLDIYNLSGAVLLVADVQGTASGTTVTFSYTFASGAPSDGVCLVAKSIHSGRVSDRAPDTGCQSVPAGSSGGGQGMS